MTLAPGTRLGTYEIASPLGAGGMGEVFRARDTKLNRDVAIKVLPALLAQDKERVARFRREAQVLASLNHPNIAAIHGLEEADGHVALVLELVAGEDLAERLKRGAIPVDEALAIAKQITEALEEAHEHGIVHRDLKPANVKVTPDGKVKVLDFGLAKALEGEPDAAASGQLSHSPTMSRHATEAGLILGTAAYMSPEQARGKKVDKRADIWSFGVVLWEMLTGQRLFEGETVSDTLAAVLTREPRWDTLPATTPPALRQLLRRCLERDPRRRLRDIGDARWELDAPADSAAPTAKLAPARMRALPWIAAALGLGLGLFGLLRAPAPPSMTSPARTARFTLLPEPSGDIDGFPALSPDGQTIVLGIVPESGVPRLWALSLTTGESRLLPDTDHGTDPFWSPDGRFVAFFSRGHLRRLELATGLARPLAAASDPRGGTWSESGEILFTPNSSAGLFRVSSDGGATTPATELDTSKQESHRYPLALPGGRSLVYTAFGSSADQTGIFWRSSRDGRGKRLAPEVSRSAYDARGYLLWVRNGTLVAQKFEPGEGDLSGEPFPLADNVGADVQRTAKSWIGAALGVVATRLGAPPTTQLRWHDRAGKRLADLTSPGSFREMMVSPDGKAVATTSGDPHRDVWIFDTGAKDRGRRLTFDGADTPTWADGGRSLVYATRGTGGSSILRRPADGSGSAETLHVFPDNAFVDSVSSRGLAALEVYSAASGEDLWLLPLDGERKARPFLNTKAAEGHASFSPDGQLLAYASDESGLPQIYAKEISGSGNRWQLTTDGGDQVVWSADGKEIFYVGFDRVLRALPVRSLLPLSVGEPAKLFKLDIPALSISGNRTFYTPSPDGRRFLVNALLARESEPGLRVILNWHPPGGEKR